MFKKHLENNYDFTEMVGLPWGGFTYALKTSSISKILNTKMTVTQNFGMTTLDYARK